LLTAAAGGSIIGSAVGFWIGRVAGYPLAIRYGGYIGLTESRLKLGQYMFLRYGGAIVLFGRFIALLRALTAFLAGANRMPWGRFMLFNIAGAIAWAGLFGIGAYELGHQMRHLAGPIGFAAFVLVVAIVVGIVWLVRRHHAELQERAERAFPGPLRPPERASGN
jgi:membrane protein DedA with SNARE-associated domain